MPEWQEKQAWLIMRRAARGKYKSHRCLIVIFNELEAWAVLLGPCAPVWPTLTQIQPSEKGALSNLASFYASLTMTNVFKWLFL